MVTGLGPPAVSSPLLISSFIFDICGIFSMIMLFLKNVCSVMCRELKGGSSDISFIEKASI